MIDDFSGYYDGPSLSKLPPGSIVDTRGVFASSVQVSEGGELMGSGGFSRFGVNPAFGTSMHVNQLFHWSPSYGGDMVLVGAKVPGYLRIGPTNEVELGTLYYPDFSFDDRFDISHPKNFSMFETFDDKVYYVDGVNFPLRIDSWQNHPLPSVSNMGPIQVESSSFIDVHLKDFAALGGPVAPGAVYAFTLVSRHGESPAQAQLVRTIFLDDAQDDYTVGTTGTSPIFLINWSVLNHAERVLWVNVYRTARGDVSTFRYVGRVRMTHSAGTSVFVDSKQDWELGYPLTKDNGLPSKFRLLASHANRMFAVGGFGRFNRLSCSKLGQPDIWPPAYELSLLDAGRGQNITYIKEINGNLYVFFTNRITRLVGFTPEDYSLEVVDNNVGCVAPRTVIPWEDGVVFLARNGLYFFNGTSRPRLVGSVYRLFDRSNLSDKTFSTVCGAISGSYYYLSFLDSERVMGSVSSTSNNKTLVLNLRNGRWGTRAAAGFDISCQVNTNQALVTTYATSGCGPVYYFSDYPLQDQLHVSPDIPLGGIDCGSPASFKVLDFVEVWYEALDEIPLAVTVYRDYPRVEAPVSGSPVASETVTVNPGTAASGATLPGVWGDSWSDTTKVFGDMVPYRVVASFDKCSSKVFTIRLNFNTGAVVGATEFRLQKVILKYRLESEPSKWGVTQP